MGFDILIFKVFYEKEILDGRLLGKNLTMKRLSLVLKLIIRDVK
jgi:hypothetical protein